MKIAMPHSLSVVFATLAIVLGSLAKTDSFPSLTPFFTGLAAIFVVAAAPNYAAKAAAFLLIPAILLSATGCSFLQSHPKVTVDSGALLACVTSELAQDAAMGDTLVTIGFDVGVACGRDALTVLEDALAQPAAKKLGSKGSFVLAMRKQNVQ